MKGYTPGDRSGFQMGTREQVLATWPLAAAALSMIVAVTAGTQIGVSGTEASTITVLVLLATLTGGAGAAGMAGSPTAPAAKPFIRLAAVVSALLVVMPVAGVTSFASPGLFLLSGPWEYALAPVLVHTAFSIGWPHRRRYWSGLVSGWYLVHLGLLIAAISGLVANETELIRIIDQTLIRSVLNPAGVVAATATLLVALGSPSRRGSHRRPVRWMFLGVVLGFGPALLALAIPELSSPIDGVLSPDQMAMAVGVFLGLAAMMSLPLANDSERDMVAHTLAQRLLDEPDLHSGLTSVASVLRVSFDVDGVSIRLKVPPVEVVDGDVRTSSENSIAPEPETVDDRRTMLAPIGRVGDPLGEVRLDARFAGAFGRREREWLAAFLFPIATTLRARRRETLHETRLAGLVKEVLGIASELKSALATIPDQSGGDETSVPASVDASQVLGQLTDGLTTISRRSDDLGGVAAEARGKVGQANDLVALGLDSLNILGTGLIRLTSWSDEIGQANKAIDNVAFRIDLLANNAALEASRAGAAGETFAVIAEEIRRLANTTAGSSDSIQNAASQIAADISSLTESVKSIQTQLRNAMRDAENGEDATRRLAEITGQLVAHARSFGPVVDEAYAVADRRTKRDDKLTESMENLIADRGSMVAALTTHRLTLEGVQRSLERIAGRSPKQQ